MSKYIIKNCPGLLKGAEKWAKGFKEDEHFCNEGEGKWCQDCTACVLKQIVDRCNIYKYSEATETTDFARREVALKILDLLQIQEVE